MIKNIFLIAFLIFCLFASYTNAAEVGYEIEFTGVKKDADLLKILEQLRDNNEDKMNLAKTPATLKQYAEAELPTYLSAIQSQGYFTGIINLKIREEKDQTKIYYNIELGEKFKVAQKKLVYKGDLKVPDLNKIEPLTGADVLTDEVKDSAKEIRKLISKNNCRVSVEVEPVMDLDAKKHTADINYEVKTATNANFGELSITGNEKVKEEYIRELLEIKKGDCFHAADIDSARTTLLNSNLFATVEIEHPAEPNTVGEVPVSIKLKERFHHTFKAGVSYFTDQGPGVNAGWEHRNFYGGGEKVDIKGVIAAYEYSAEGNYTEPFFLRKDQSLKLGAKLAQEYPEAYTSTNLEISSGLERKIDKNITAGAGLAYRLSEVEEESTGDTENYGLFSIPVFGQWDNRDDSLNASKGIFARIDSAPYFDTFGSGAYFIRNKASASTYFRLAEENSSILALRGAFGFITADSTSSVPADLRYYAGGGSSVRGYGYQELGPTTNGKPDGGRSLLEGAAELRFLATDDMGGVIFLDGGNAFDSIYPDFKQDLQFGAGVGFRYYSDFGPVRVDVAVPVNKRETDDAFQLYVSLGQAF